MTHKDHNATHRWKPLRLMGCGLGLMGLLTLWGCGKRTAETTVQRRDMTEMVFASGVLEPENKYNLVAQSDGYLIALEMEEGDLVQPGQVLAVIDNAQSQISAASAQQLVAIARSNAASSAPALLQVKANIDAAEARYRQDSLQAARLRRLREANTVSQVEMENAQLAATASRTTLESLREQYRSLKTAADQQVIIQQSQADVNAVASGNNTVKAILGGRVYRRNKQLGDFVRRGEVIAMIGHADSLYAKLSIDEASISRIQAGQKATVALNTQKTKPYPAHVRQLLPSFDELNQSFTVEAAFDTLPPFKVSGTQLEANILIGTKPQALVIPRSYLGYASKVKVKRDGKWQDVVIQTGFVGSEWVEVLGGLQEGETIQTDRVQ